MVDIKDKVEEEYYSHIDVYRSVNNIDAKHTCKNICYVLGHILGIKREDTNKALNEWHVIV